MRNGFPDERCEGGFIDAAPLRKINRPPDIALEAGVEQMARISQRSPLGERELHCFLVGNIGK